MKPKIGIYGLTGCAGDQLMILNCEDELLTIFSVCDVHSFLMAKSDNEDKGLDIAFVEGSVSTDENERHLNEIRRNTKLLVAIGTCACFGGIQASLNHKNDFLKRLKKVYNTTKFSVAKPKQARALDEVVKVDYYITGCPIEKEEFLKAVTQLLHLSSPESYKFSVCTECKWRENECLILEGEICLGPITRAGCGASCPSHNLPCYGCRGLVDEANIASEVNLLKEKGYETEEILRRVRTFGGIKAMNILKEILEESCGLGGQV